MSDLTLPAVVAPVPPGRLRKVLRRHPTVFIGGGVIALMVILAAVAPLFAGNPLAMDPMHRLRPPSVRCIGSAPTIWGATCLRVRCTAHASLCSSGLSVAVGGPRRRTGDRVVVRLLPAGRCRADAPDGRADGDPVHPARDRAGVAVPGRCADRDPGDPDPGDCRATCGWCAPSCWACANSHT